MLSRLLSAVLSLAVALTFAAAVEGSVRSSGSATWQSLGTELSLCAAGRADARLGRPPEPRAAAPSPHALPWALVDAASSLLIVRRPAFLERRPTLLRTPWHFTLSERSTRGPPEDSVA